MKGDYQAHMNEFRYNRPLEKEAVRVGDLKPGTYFTLVDDSEQLYVVPDQLIPPNPFVYVAFGYSYPNLQIINPETLAFPVYVSMECKALW